MQADMTAAPARRKWLRWQDCLAFLLFLALTAGLYALVNLRLRADTALEVQLPDIPITLGNQIYDSTDAAHPMLMYQGVIYFPACEAGRIGLQAEQTDNGLALFILGKPDETGAAASSDRPNPLRDGASPYDKPVTIENKPFQSGADTPYLYYHGTPYFPLTEALCTALCLDYTQSDAGEITLKATGRLRAPTDALPQFILHMAGMTETGEISTNSVEAASHSYREGYRWLEIDFNWTKDEALVCTHDWGNWRKRLGIKVKTPPTLRRFYRLEYEYSDTHSFTPKRLDTWIKKHPEAMFVTDAKEDNVRVMRWIAENYPDLREHFIVQIYALEEYEPIRALGYENIILTMYKIPWEEYHDIETLSAFIRDTRILAITMAADENVRDVFDALVDTGIPIYVHTLDEPEEQARWLADGAYGIYTNYGDMRAE